jgi:hypothetical protein
MLMLKMMIISTIPITVAVIRPYALLMTILQYKLQVELYISSTNNSYYCHFFTGSHIIARRLSSAFSYAVLCGRSLVVSQRCFLAPPSWGSKHLWNVSKCNDRGSKHLCEVSKLLPDCAAQQLRRQPCSCLLLWEPESLYHYKLQMTDISTSVKKNTYKTSKYGVVK